MLVGGWMELRQSFRMSYCKPYVGISAYVCMKVCMYVGREDVRLRIIALTLDEGLQPVCMYVGRYAGVVG